MNTEQLRKAHARFTALQDLKDKIDANAQIEIDGYIAVPHFHIKNKIEFSFWKGSYLLLTISMSAYLSINDELIFTRYGQYSKVDAYIIKQEFKNNIAMA